MSRTVYLDVDTGVDDALALLLAALHPALDVRGVTTVVGNVDLELVTRNTIQVLDVAGATDVPVVSGARRPLVAEARPAAEVHGPDGLGGADLAPPSREPSGGDAVGFLRDELARARDPVTLIALGPLTNIALLLVRAPEVKRKIERIALMGGAVGSGNVTPVAEFNIFHDPEAADVVFRSGVPILMYGLDVFRRVTFTKAEVDTWFAANATAGTSAGARRAAVCRLAAHLLDFMIRQFGRSDATIGDAGCVASVIDPSGLTTEDLPVLVETGGRHCRGQTVVDRRPPSAVGRHTASPSVTQVALDINAEVYRALFRDTLLGLGDGNG